MFVGAELPLRPPPRQTKHRRLELRIEFNHVRVFSRQRSARQSTLLPSIRQKLYHHTQADGESWRTAIWNNDGFQNITIGFIGRVGASSRLSSHHERGPRNLAPNPLGKTLG